MINSPLFKGAAELVYPVVVGEEFHQPEGEPESRDQMCCFGARLAIEFCMPHDPYWSEEPTDDDDDRIEYWDYNDGVEWLLGEANCSHKDICDVLFMCGAADNPFGPYEWPHHPEVVIARMWSVEEPPGLSFYGGTGYDAEEVFIRCTGKSWAQAEADFDKAVGEVG